MSEFAFSDRDCDEAELRQRDLIVADHKADILGDWVEMTVGIGHDGRARPASRRVAAVPLSLPFDLDLSLPGGRTRQGRRETVTLAHGFSATPSGDAKGAGGPRDRDVRA